MKTIGVMGERTCDRVVAGAPSSSQTNDSSVKFSIAAALFRLRQISA
ncbi:hypothetical protein ABIF63_006568 [Bradyrhizobium japonicum]|uniref:Uncharacterized protein n=1 Tax=Bradyrhizobium japonicum TaxID=375 RepID=A0ABV2RZU3_BRAJP|nr:hypothetical protein [Bradyrhizobium japonicum]MCS3502292.1 hypothetical protein [Bradyrhizobium japonicum]MCS3964995.1 hypothetical protein [Bradyrhizobium japonicum]MCS3997302.1 hypothetical protein [Bradyrhizobium japonicum]UQD94672.1 hypothetical protein JEY30_23730 [Bradyrhizobium japonicum]WLB15474.1 hypothetical protein QIH95_25840 [Bradyrhizobium japonicum]